MDKELKVTIQKLGMQLETMPAIDTVTSSALIAEIGDIHRFESSDKLARYAGIAPMVYFYVQNIKLISDMHCEMLHT